jgi:hypothetical protein
VSRIILTALLIMASASVNAENVKPGQATQDSATARGCWSVKDTTMRAECYRSAGVPEKDVPLQEEPESTPFPEWARQDVRIFCAVEHANDIFCKDRSDAAEIVLRQEWDRIKDDYKTRCLDTMAERAQGLAYTWAHFGDLSDCIDALATHDARFK